MVDSQFTKWAEEWWGSNESR